jgi:hypothetical protein
MISGVRLRRSREKGMTTVREEDTAALELIRACVCAPGTRLRTDVALVETETRNQSFAKRVAELQVARRKWQMLQLMAWNGLER